MRPKLIALIAVSAVALVGCAAGEPSVESSKASAKPEAAPLVMTEAEAIAESSSAPIPESSETDFITFMQPDFSGWKGELPSDEDLLAAGYLACEKLDDGVPEMEVEVIPGSLPTLTPKEEKEMTAPEIARFRFDNSKGALYENNRQIITSAISALCKQHILG